MLLWPTFFTPTEMLPVACVAVDWGGEAVLAPFYSLASLYKNAKACPASAVRLRPILSTYEMNWMALTIFVPNLAGIHQPVLKLYQTAIHPALSPVPVPLPCLPCPIWLVRMARNSRGSGFTTWGVTSGRRFGLAHFLSHSYYFALFAEVTWHLGHVIDVKHSL